MTEEAYVDVYVAGVPVPQGSLRSSRYGHLYYSNAKKLNPWRRAVQEAVEDALAEDHEAIDEGMFIEMTFYFPRPASVKRPQKLTAPDVDKLARAVHDALTEAKLYTDDSRVVGFIARKFYSDELHEPGVRVRAWRDNDVPMLGM